MQLALAPKSVELPNRVKLPYVEQGEPSGVTVLLVHGFTDSWRSFERVLPLLPKSIHAIALTLRGHGDASRPAEGYRYHDFAEDLAAFMEAIHLEAAVIAGDSLGGIIAQRFVIDHPERVLGLMLIDSPATLVDKPGIREMWNSTISKLVDPVDPGFVREFVASALAQPVPQAFLEAMLQESLKVPARVWKAAVESFMEEDFSSECNKIEAPTLLICGEQDAFARSDQEALKATIAGARLVMVPHAGHALCWEEPERVAVELVAFIKGLMLHVGNRRFTP